jgi:hypothetical protein
MKRLELENKQSSPSDIINQTDNISQTMDKIKTEL